MGKARLLVLASAVAVALASTAGVASAAAAAPGRTVSHSAASVQGGPPGWGYIATFQSPYDCSNYGVWGQNTGKWSDFVCVAADGAPGRWELWVP